MSTLSSILPWKRRELLASLSFAPLFDFLFEQFRIGAIKEADAAYCVGIFNRKSCRRFIVAKRYFDIVGRWEAGCAQRWSRFNWLITASSFRLLQT